MKDGDNIFKHKIFLFKVTLVVLTLLLYACHSSEKSNETKRQEHDEKRLEASASVEDKTKDKALDIVAKILNDERLKYIVEDDVIIDGYKYHKIIPFYDHLEKIEKLEAYYVNIESGKVMKDNLLEKGYIVVE